MSRARNSATTGIDDDREISLSLKDRRTTGGTKANYNGKLKVFCEWAREKRPTALTEVGMIRKPIERADLIDFFGYLCRPAHERSKMTPTEIVALRIQTPTLPLILKVLEVP